LPCSRAQQGPEHRALVAALAGERDRRQELGARIVDVGIGGGEIGFRLADIGALRQQFGRQARRHVQDRDGVEAAATHMDALGRACDQYGERGAVLLQRLLQRRDGGALSVEHALLQGHVELGGSAGSEPLLDQLEHVGRVLHVLACDTQAILRREHLKICIGCAHHGGERNHFAVEAAGDRRFFRGAQRRAVLAPEVNLVAGVERAGQQISLGAAERTGGAAGRG
jgi:hypothetical protein